MVNDIVGLISLMFESFRISGEIFKANSFPCFLETSLIRIFSTHSPEEPIINRPLSRLISRID